MKEKIKNARKFLRENTRGGVTVFICLVLVPVLMFTGFMVDIARIKLYHSEAAFAADNYADSVLSQYNELLYDVYGLISVTQDEEALEALETVKGYIESAYNPSASGRITDVSHSNLQYIPNSINFIGNSDKIKNSWSPYGNTKMILQYEVDKSTGGANLGNQFVFADQVCDYMKVIGPVDLVWNGLAEVFGESDETKQNQELMNAQKDVETAYNKLDDSLADLYTDIKKLNEYNEWSVPDSVIAEHSYVKSTYNSIYRDLTLLAGGDYYHEETTDMNSVIGKFFAEIFIGIQDGKYFEWKEEINSGNATFNGNNPLYKVYCYCAVLDTEKNFGKEQKEVTYKGVKVKTADVPSQYHLGYRIAEAKENVEKDFERFEKELSGDNGVIKDLDRVIEDLAGNNGVWGTGAFAKKGVNAEAAQANDARDNLLNKCEPLRTDNEMAAGMYNDYSIESDNEASEELAYVSNFDYGWLQGKYTENKNYLTNLQNKLATEKASCLSQLSSFKDTYITDLKNYIDTRLDNLDSYAADTGRGAATSQWMFSKAKKQGDSNYFYNMGFGEAGSPFINRDSFTVSMGENAWFKIDVSPNGSGENQDHHKLWEILDKWYGAGDAQGKGKAKTTEYKELLKELKDSISGGGDAGQSLINAFSGCVIPDCVNSPNGHGDASEQSVTDLFGEEGDYSGDELTTDGTARSVEYYMTKLLVMDYDWNFFTNAVFGKDPDEENAEDKFKGQTLKGEEISTETNYLVKQIEGQDCLGGAELEYIYWGNRDAQKNLKAVRTQLTLIRAVENFASTYSIKEINNAINAIKSALAGIPIAALIVPPLIRAAIAMAETYMDLKALYEGQKIAVYKTKIEHLTLLNNPALKSTLDKIFSKDNNGGGSPLNSKSGGDDDDTLMFDYSQFVLLCTMMFCDTPTIVERTQTLVELNMNHRLKADFGSNELKFRLSNACVAVNAKCRIDEMDLLVLGGIFTDEASNEYLGDEDIQILKRGFKYKVSRSY